MKFAHLSDIHLGSWSAHPELRELSFVAFEKAMNICIAENVDFIIIAGDLFDTSLPSIDILRKATAVLRNVKEEGIRIYCVPGSHDYSPTGKTFVNVLEDAGLLTNIAKWTEEEGKIKLQFFIDKTGAKLCGMEGRMGGLELGLFEKFNKDIENEEGFKIFVFHSGIQEFLPELLKEKMKVVPLELLPKKFNYYAAGHIHYTHTEEYNGAKIIFPGPTFPTDLKELEEHKSGFFISEVNEESIDTNFVPVRTKDVHAINVNANGKSITKIENEITDNIEMSYVKDKIVLVKIEGTLDSGKPSDIKFREIISKSQEKGAYTTKKNTTKLKTKEFEEVEVAKNLSVAELEKEIIKKHLGQMNIWNKENEEKLVLALMSVFEDDKQEGETNYSFEERVKNNAMKVIGI